jgi:hypothetical protein
MFPFFPSHLSLPPFPLCLFTPVSYVVINADDRLIPHSDLVECNYSSILYQPVSPQYGGREYADDKVRRYMNMESMVKIVWMRLA